jgi:hypothetical protein
MELVAGGRRFTNDWSSWLYPAVIRPAGLPVPAFADEDCLKQLPGWNIQAIATTGELNGRAVYLTSWPCDPRILDAVKRGSLAIFIDGTDQLVKSRTIPFRSSWWRAGDDDKNHTGTFVYDHLATRQMAPDGWCDDGWFHLIEGSKKMELETTPGLPDILIRALPGMFAVKDYALLFEVGVEKGAIIASGLNHRRAQGRPENEWLIARLLEYAATFPRPKAEWPASFFSMTSVAPEGCVPGFRRLLSNEGEDGIWYSFREDNARVLISRQTIPGNRVTWVTAPVPKEPADDRVTFVFAGGLGFGSEPKTEGFVLEINGKDAVRFDLPEPKTWQSSDGRVQLRFDSRRTVAIDQFGLFHLTVPRDMLKSGEPCILSVRSLGKDSRRWFGLNTYF